MNLIFGFLPKDEGKDHPLMDYATLCNQMQIEDRKVQQCLRVIFGMFAGGWNEEQIRDCVDTLLRRLKADYKPVHRRIND